MTTPRPRRPGTPAAAALALLAAAVTVAPAAERGPSYRPEIDSVVEAGVRVDRPRAGSFLRLSARLEARAAPVTQPAPVVQLVVVERPRRDTEALRTFYERYPAGVVRALLPMPGVVPAPAGTPPPARGR